MKEENRKANEQNKLVAKLTAGEISVEQFVLCYKMLDNIYEEEPQLQEAVYS